MPYEQRLQLLIGSMYFQLVAKEIEVEQLKDEIVQLKTQLPEKSPNESAAAVE